MSLLKVIAVMALVAAATARPDSPTAQLPPTEVMVHPSTPYGAEQPKYSFEWAVKDDYSGNDFGHHETRDGYNTEGSYYVLLPDGRIQKVTYTVTKDGGYLATVEYEGEIKHDHYGKPPAYGPPPTPAYGQH